MEAEKDFFVINKDEYVRDEIKIKRSIFICHLKYAENIETAKSFISSISNEYKDANHNCWAYIIGKKADIFHSSDAGEPSGTAGKPILNTLQKYNLTNVVCVVTRYFGGTLLGVRGLIDAYSGITEKTILSINLNKLVETFTYQVILDYDFFEVFQHYVKCVGGNINNISYNNKIELCVAVGKIFNLEIQKYLDELSKKNKVIFKQL